jgi:hypothetical protein
LKEQGVLLASQGVDLMDVGVKLTEVDARIASLGISDSIKAALVSAISGVATDVSAQFANQVFLHWEHTWHQVILLDPAAIGRTLEELDNKAIFAHAEKLMRVVLGLKSIVGPFVLLKLEQLLEVVSIAHDIVVYDGAALGFNDALLWQQKIAKLNLPARQAASGDAMFFDVLPTESIRGGLERMCEVLRRSDTVLVEQSNKRIAEESKSKTKDLRMSYSGAPYHVTFNHIVT